ncbi:cupin domain-containing protein [uncultured Paenibacillus sp.]|uniref:cupin domain-containing protein n=1 Tax=uncultured Paenibacillus sp. TaxID=227322 RepID=UPI0015B03460|nr:cupin domain-containing protein [uncultured Paenibacillus sp.]
MEKLAITGLQDYQTEKFTKRIAFKKGESVVFMLNFMPGQELPTHTHPNTDVFILALQGSGSITVDGVTSPLGQGEALHLEGAEAFSYRNDGDEPASLYVVLTKVPAPEYAQNI